VIKLYVNLTGKYNRFVFLLIIMPIYI